MADLVTVAAIVAIVTIGASTGLVVDRYRTERDTAVARVDDNARTDAAVAQHLVRDRLALLALLAADESIRSGDPVRMAARLVDVEQQSLVFTGGIAWVDSTGRLQVLSDEAEPDEVSFADRDWFVAAMGGRAVVGSAVASRLRDAAAVTFAVPTTDEAGNRTGVLAAGMLLEAFTFTDGQFLDGLGVGDGDDDSVSYLIDRSGALIPGGLVDGEPVRRAAGSSPSWTTTGGIESGVTDAWGRTDRVVAWEPVPAAGWLAVRSYDRGALLSAPRRKLWTTLAGLGVAGAGFEVLAIRHVMRLRRRERSALETMLAERAERERAESLGTVMAALAAAGSLQEAARTVSAMGLPLFGCRGGIALLDRDDPAYLVAVSGTDGEQDPAPTPGRVLLQPSTAVGDAVLDGRLVFTSPGEADRDAASALGIPFVPDGAWLVVPLSDGTHTVGVMVGAFERPDDCDETARVGVELLAERVAGVLVVAAEHEFEHLATLTFQRSLLPAEPASIDGVAVRARYRPANEGFGVGGDWYETFALGPDRLMVIVGDLVGHGVGAAAAMGRLSTAARALAPAHTPVTLLRALDDFARRDEGAFAGTVACILVDRSTDTVECAVAGHPPPVVVRHDGTATVQTGPAGPVLALGDHRRSARFPLDGVRAVVLYTDGVVERRGEAVDAGIERLLAAVGSAADEPGALSCDAVLARCLPSSHADDAVLVVVEFDRPCPDLGEDLEGYAVA
jgi:hypothetical protein